jgi:hypothetical protein
LWCVGDARRTKERSIVTAIARPNDWQVSAATPSDDDARVGVSHPHRSDVIDVSRPPSREGLWKMLLEWLEAAALVWLAAVALIAVGILLVLVVRAIVTALSWVVGRIG